MTKELGSAFEQIVEIMKKDTGISGAWNLGSITHELADEYSDINIVFLVKADSFERVNECMQDYLKKACDEVVLCWPESFNSDAIINNGYLLRKGQQLMQLDIFLINEDKLDDYICRVHYTDLKMEYVVFDREGQVRKLIEKSPKGETWNSDLETLNTSYWFHINMSIKYLKRKDFFKLHYLMRTLMDTHVALLLNGYDQIPWGNKANKLNFLPEEKQEPVRKMCLDLIESVRRRAFTDHGLKNEWVAGQADELRIWWVQAEGVVGFINAYEKTMDKKFLDAAASIWEYIKEFQIDKRSGSEWYNEIDENHKPIESELILGPWKCPYHNGRMCMEMQDRISR